MTTREADRPLQRFVRSARPVSFATARTYTASRDATRGVALFLWFVAIPQTLYPIDPGEADHQRDQGDSQGDSERTADGLADHLAEGRAFDAFRPPEIDRMGNCPSDEERGLETKRICRGAPEQLSRANMQ
jgi:hypothetical protein